MPYSHQYTSQYTSHNWVSRTWLVITNTFLVLVSIGGIVIGAIALQLRNNSKGDINTSSVFETFQGPEVANISVGFKAIGIALLSYFSLLLVVSLCGCIGAIQRNNVLLGIFICVLGLNLGIFLAGGIFVLISLKRYTNRWNSNTLADWKNLTTDDQTLIQYSFSCCGFQKNDGTAFTGNSTYAFTNPCSASTYVLFAAGCQDAVTQSFNNAFYGILGGVIFLSLVLSVSLGAAHFSRRHIYEQGKIAVYTQPLIR